MAAEMARGMDEVATAFRRFRPAARCKENKASRRYRNTRSITGISDGNEIVSRQFQQANSWCVSKCPSPVSHHTLMLVCVQVLHEKPTLVTNRLACAGSVKMMMMRLDLMKGTAACCTRNDSDVTSITHRRGHWAWYVLGCRPALRPGRATTTTTTLSRLTAAQAGRSHLRPCWPTGARLGMPRLPVPVGQKAGEGPRGQGCRLPKRTTPRQATFPQQAVAHAAASGPGASNQATRIQQPCRTG